ncbi:SsrA-binding protein SmpB [Candidatus Dojkabacteria bacterium]|nr:SsrA-binding protein SmpB [Candidatus Dojkabacteria bacterium]
MKILGKNKKAFRDYEIIKRFEAGMVLEGWEVKSIKSRNFSLKESHVSQRHGEMWIYGMHVSSWKFGGSLEEMDEQRPKKLLLHKKEIEYLIGSEQRKGLTIIPLSVYLERGFIKIEIALAKGKKQYDKRKKIKERDQKRRIERDLKSLGY